MSEGNISRRIAQYVVIRTAYPSTDKAQPVSRGQRSDLVVKTAMRTYRLHQISICARSGSLGSLCALEAAEDGLLQGSLDLRGEDPEATDCMLQYLYKDDYHAPEPQARPS